MENETSRKKNNKSKKIKIKNKGMKSIPTPHCQSIIMSTLSVRTSKMMEKNSGRFFTNTSPRNPVFLHGLVLCINEAIKPTISLKIVAHVFKVRAMDIQNILITHEHLDKELASLQEIQPLEIKILKCKEQKIQIKKDDATKELRIWMDQWTIENRGHSC